MSNEVNAMIEVIRWISIIIYQMQVSEKTLKTISKVSNKKNTEKESSWEALIKGIIRPPKSNYKESSLGTYEYI